VPNLDVDRQREHNVRGAEDTIVSNILIDLLTADIAGCPKECTGSADGI
jgi:hypothetical protein